MALNGKAAKWFKGLFKGPTMPTAPTAAQLYSGPQAFSGYQPEAARVQTNPAAMAALQQLQGMSTTGWSATDQAAQQQSQRQAALGEQSQRAGVMQQAAMRGQAGGGAALAGALAAQQGGADRANAAASDFAARGADRRLGATQAAGSMGMGLTDQATQRASATDQFNQWASGAQSAATQGAYDNAMTQYQAQAAKRKQMWDRVTGGISGLTSVIQTRRQGGD